MALGLVERLKNSDFISESKIVGLYQNKNSKQPDQPIAMWKLYFTLEINQYHIQHNCCLHVFFNVQHIFLGHGGCIWKINLRTLWNYTMKNFRVRHRHCDIIIFSETFSLGNSSNYNGTHLAGLWIYLQNLS